jgi:glycosyltransferase involved in cell wall biosynthesis
LKFPQIVTVIHNQLNLRPSGALTTGIEYARAHGYNWIWVLDADTRPRRGTLESLNRLTEADRNIGVVAPPQVSGRGKPTCSMTLRLIRAAIANPDEATSVLSRLPDQTSSIGVPGLDITSSRDAQYRQALYGAPSCLPRTYRRVRAPCGCRYNPLRR